MNSQNMWTNFAKMLHLILNEASEAAQRQEGKTSRGEF